MSEAETQGIVVTVRARYVPEQSRPAQPMFFFAYRVAIENRGASPAQLVTRHWIIRDGRGREEHVRGPGVVGETPRLSPGERFEYTSFCPLPTPSGSMSGTYHMRRDDGETFDAEVAPFSLLADHMRN